MSNLHNTPRQRLRSTFQSLTLTNTLKKSQLEKAVIYTGSKYNHHILQQEIANCPDQIDYQQFVKVFQVSECQKEQENQRRQIQRLFKMYDYQNKGYINDTDLKRVSEISGIQLSQSEIKQMLKDGKIFLQDFLNIMNHSGLFV